MSRLFIILPNIRPYLTKTIVSHRQEIEQTREQLQKAELTFTHQVT